MQVRRGESGMKQHIPIDEDPCVGQVSYQFQSDQRLEG